METLANASISNGIISQENPEDIAVMSNQPIALYRDMRLNKVIEAIEVAFSDHMLFYNAHLILRYTGEVKEFAGNNFYTFLLIAVLLPNGDMASEQCAKILNTVQTVSYSGARAKYLIDRYRDHMFDLTHIEYKTKIDAVSNTTYTFYDYTSYMLNDANTAVLEQLRLARITANSNTNSNETISFQQFIQPEQTVTTHSNRRRSPSSGRGKGGYVPYKN